MQADLSSWESQDKPPPQRILVAPIKVYIEPRSLLLLCSGPKFQPHYLDCCRHLSIILLLHTLPPLDDATHCGWKNLCKSDARHHYVSDHNRKYYKRLRVNDLEIIYLFICNYKHGGAKIVEIRGQPIGSLYHLGPEALTQVSGLTEVSLLREPYSLAMISYLFGCFAFTLFMVPHVCLVHMEVRRVYQVTWSWS